MSIDLRSQIPLAVVLLGGVALWASGSLHLGEEASPAGDGHDHAPAADAHDHGGDAHGAEADCANPGHDHEGDWCAEHGVPESACVKCDPALVGAFQARGDWCGEHGVPESHCAACNPAPAEGLPGVKGDLAVLETVSCEHGIRTVDCDGCRFEIGVVKVEKALADSLLETGRVEEGEAAEVLDATGEVALATPRVVDVTTTAGGRVLGVVGSLGQRVEKGDLLAVIHSGEYGEAKAAYLEAWTGAEIARREKERRVVLTTALDELLDRLAEQHDAGDGTGDDVEEVILETPGAVGEWRSKLVGAASRLRLARLKHTREKALEEKGIAARAEHEEAHQDLETAEAEYHAMVEEVRLSLDLENLRADNEARRAAVAVLATEQRLRILGIGEEGLSALREGRHGEEFARLEVRAPRSGVVTAMEVAEGRYVEANHTLFTVADLSTLWVWCDLYERDLAAVAGPVAGGGSLPAAVRVTSFPGEEFAGTLDHLGSSIDEHTRTLKARVVVDNPDGRIRPGMFARVRVRIPTGGTVRTVPGSAVLTDEGAAFVFQHWKDELWVRRDVTVRRTWGDRVEIEGEVPVGAEVATGGAFMLKSEVLRDKMGAG